jgi:molybdate transport system substrate-binding protein
VNVYADALLTDALRGVRSEYVLEHPGAAIELAFVEPGALAARLAATPNANIALSIEPGVFEELAKQNRLEGGAQVLITDPLAIIIARTNPEGILKLQDLNRNGLRIAIASEDTILGQQSRLLIANLNELPRFRTDFTDQILNSAIAQPSNGGAILNLVASHQADVGIVFASQAVLEEKRVFILDVPPEAGVSVDYSVGVLKTNRDPEDVQQFLDFLFSPRAQDAVSKYGFKPPR